MKNWGNALISIDMGLKFAQQGINFVAESPYDAGNAVFI